jgi:hypothetical protein
MHNMNSYWLITKFRNYAYIHIRLMTCGVATNANTVVSILFYYVSKRCCVDWPLIYPCRIDTQQDAYHKRHIQQLWHKGQGPQLTVVTTIMWGKASSVNLDDSHGVRYRVRRCWWPPWQEVKGLQWALVITITVNVLIKWLIVWQWT